MRAGYQADVFRYCQIFGPVRTRSLEDHHHEVVGMGTAHVRQEFAHALLHLAIQHSVEVALQRVDCTVALYELSFIALEHHNLSPRQGRSIESGRAMRPKRASS